MIRTGKCIHQNRCSYCNNEEERTRRVKLLQYDIDKCHTDHERELLEEKKVKLEEPAMYKPSQCLSPLSENSGMFGHSLHSYCEHRCTPVGGEERRFMQIQATDVEHLCVLIPCHQASGHIPGTIIFFIIFSLFY